MGKPRNFFMDETSIHYWVGGLEHEFYFSTYWEFHHPKSQPTHIFQRGRYTTNQLLYIIIFSFFSLIVGLNKQSTVYAIVHVHPYLAHIFLIGDILELRDLAGWRYRVSDTIFRTQPTQGFTFNNNPIYIYIIIPCYLSINPYQPLAI